MDTPDPPSLDETDPNEYDDAEIVGETDYRRDEIEAYLENGAWDTAFEQWLGESELDETELRIVLDLDFVQEFDFFWDSYADRVGYHAPGIPEDWKEREYHHEIDSWSTVSAINAEMTELGQIVCDVLKGEYIDWESDYEPPDDLPDFE